MAVKLAYMKGGPCDGKTRRITAGVETYGSIECKGGLYLISVPAKRHDGHRVFNYSGDAISPGTPPASSAAHLHKGYADLRHSVNRNFPAALAASHRSLQAGLRSLHRAHRVKL